MISTGATTPSAASSSTRELLLSRLARERLMHSHTSPASAGDTARRASDRVSLAHNASGSIITDGGGGVVDGQVDDSAERAAEREAKLRSQAQLRVRLAAAKKEATCSMEDRSTREDDSAMRGGTRGIGGAIQSQEEVLRNMLAERRRSSVAHK